MKALSPLKGIGVLLGIGVLVAIIVVGAHLLRPTPGPLLGAIPRAAGVACDDEVRHPDPVPARSGTLLACPQRFDGRQVQLQGEAIGDLLGRGPGRWVLLNDDDYAHAGPLMAHHQTLGTNGGMAVLLPLDALPAALGGPGVWGDLLVVTGTFHAAAVVDQGGAAVIATTAEVLRPGGPVNPLPARAQRIAAPLMVAAAAVLAAIARVRRRL